MFKALLISILLCGSCWAQLVIPPITAECATSIDGSVVGTPNPLHVPVVSPVLSGALPSGNYFVEIGWYDAATHTTLPSPEVQVQLVSTGELQISPPLTGMPATALGMQIYIGTSSGGETLQGSTVGSATFTQSVTIIAGPAVPTVNATVCQVIANDAGWPSGTGYNMSLTSPSGSTLPGYPLQVQFLGPGNTINLSAGLPLYNGTVTYPVPILSRPYGHGPQSIAGPLSMTNYNLTSVAKIGLGTSVPAWAVDAEGSALLGAINANTGYLYNGLAPNNHLLCGNGNYYVDCSTVPSSALPSLYYQTIDLNNVAQTQRPVLNFSTSFGAADSSSPAQTNITLAATGVTAAAYTNPSSVTVNAQGQVTAIVSGTALIQYGSAAGCVSGSGTPCNVTLTWPVSFADSTYIVVCSGVGPVTGNPQPAFIYTGTQTASTVVVTTDNRGTTNSGGFTTVNCSAHHN